MVQYSWRYSSRSAVRVLLAVLFLPGSLVVSFAAFSQTLPTLRTTFVARDAGQPSPCVQTTCFDGAAYDGNILIARGYAIRSSIYVFARLSSGPWYRQATLRNYRAPFAVAGDEILLTAGACETHVLARTDNRWRVKQVIPVCGDEIAQDGARMLFVKPSGQTMPIYARGANGLYAEEGSFNPWSQVSLHESISVAMHGWTIVIGEPISNGESGRAHIFQRRGGAWSLGKTLIPGPELALTRFGWTVAAGEFDVAISAPLASAGAGEGKVFIYSGVGENWFVRQEIKQPPGSVNKFFGTAIALRGRRMVISADTTYGGGYPGPYTYLYERGLIDPDWFPRAQFATRNGATRRGPSIFLSGSTAMVDVPGYALADYPLGTFPSVVNLPALRERNQPE